MPKRKCPHCKAYKDRDKMIILNNRAFCNLDHAIEYARINSHKGEERRKKKQRQEQMTAKKAVRTRAKWYTMLQKEVNQYVRLRDKGNPCCTCGNTNKSSSHNGSLWHAGHYITAKYADSRRFELTNVHLQCAKCNMHNGGMPKEYRQFMINKYGIEHVEWLECNVNFKPLKEQFATWQDLEGEIIRYRKLIRGLKENG